MSLHYYTLDEATRETGLEKHRLRYIEARFPKLINRRLFDDQGRFYSQKHLQSFQHLDSLIRSNNPEILKIDRDNAGIRSRGRLLVVASGKGGVGKTSMAVNLAVLAAKSRNKVTLIDGDLGLANAHVLLGVNPRETLAHVANENQPLSAIELETHFGLKLIPGGSSDFDLANLSGRGLEWMTQELMTTRRHSDFVILDAPAGIGKAVLSWVGASDELIVVTTPAPTALLDAYGLIKIALEKGYTGKIHVLVNQVSSLDHGRQTFTQLQTCTQRFLQHYLHYLGAVRKDSRMDRCMIARSPLVLSPEPSPAIRNLQAIANTLFQKER